MNRPTIFLFDCLPVEYHEAGTVHFVRAEPITRDGLANIVNSATETIAEKCNFTDIERDDFQSSLNELCQSMLDPNVPALAFREDLINNAINEFGLCVLTNDNVESIIHDTFKGVINL